MKYTRNVWDKDALKNPETEYQNLLGSLRNDPSFGMFFVRCSPAEGEQIIKRIKVDVAHHTINVLRLDQSVDDFYEMFSQRIDLHGATILFVTGIEEFLEHKINDIADARLIEKLGHVPRPLAHLSLMQSKLKQFPIRFIFLLPLFALKFFIDSYSEFFEESVTVFEFPTDMELLRQEAFRWVSGDRYEAYAQLTAEERDQKYEDLQKLIAAQPLISERRIELLLEQGGLLVAGNRCQEAIANCDLAIQIRADNHLAWYNRAVALDLSDHHEEAVENYRHALSFKEDFYAAWHNLGTSLSMLGRYEEAINSYNIALKHKPDYHFSYGGKGLVYSVLGKYEEAIKHCEKALALRPDYVQGWFSRAYALESIGKYGEAVASYDRALEYKPRDHQIWYSRAKALEQWGNFTEAISSYDQALEIRPDDYYAWNNRGLVLSKLELYEEAIISHDQALEINPEDHFAWYSRGNALSGLGRLEEAINCYDKAIQISPQEPQVWQSRRLALRRLGFD
ncbi:tetratricopeptide repeat protein [Pseudanabaena sp. FACHB-1998]|uniref:tetratricopeptide repeat protein n=1 Tax=Pseudanabaena sp. FACHB-1998 TaxID=2692858 RepID=UPI0016810D1B|nr:tetratricopeptide repeat protein [Pseudanabaena sp. FACHB-1998]MBD2175848.1 tetratricopeptide repeat protein [Pseudanabaena sp. FACHB-1998]